MKNIVITAAIVMVGFVLFSTWQHFATQSEEKKVTISGAWALYPMAIRWAQEYEKEHPDIKIDISAGGAGKGMADALAGIVDLGMVSRKIYPDEIKKGAWWVPVAKDAVVATMSANNPFKDAILSRGLTKQNLFDIWIQKTITDWKATIPCQGVDCPREAMLINVYTRSDACGAADTWALYLNRKQEDLQGIGIYGDPGIADVVKRDPLGIGYNNINYAYDAKTRRPIEGLLVIPIDFNGNGKVDTEEDLYASLDTLTAAIMDGRYPSPPARDLFLVSHGPIEKAAARDFVTWVLTEGQQYVLSSGYIPVSQEKIDQALKDLQAAPSKRP